MGLAGLDFLLDLTKCRGPSARKGRGPQDDGTVVGRRGVNARSLGFTRDDSGGDGAGIMARIWLVTDRRIPWHL
jgi:hypothetical protein